MDLLRYLTALVIFGCASSGLMISVHGLLLWRTKRRPRRCRGEDVAATMPYIDINPHRQRPKWLGYVVLAVLAVLALFVVIVALAGP